MSANIGSEPPNMPSFFSKRQDKTHYANQIFGEGQR